MSIERTTLLYMVLLLLVFTATMIAMYSVNHRYVPIVLLVGGPALLFVGVRGIVKLLRME